MQELERVLQGHVLRGPVEGLVHDLPAGALRQLEAQVQRRREQEHRLSLFYMERLSNKIEKVWWDNVKTSDKEEIRRYYSNQLDYLSHSIEIRDYMWYSYKVFDIWEEWFDYIKVEFKPNKVTYRQDKLKILGI